MIITFEGIDGVGKATQAALLAQRLRAEGKHVTVFSIPRYRTIVGSLIKQALHGAYGNFRHLDPHLSSLPYFLDFAAARDEIARAEKRGVVIFDRYVHSTFAYHGAKLRGFARGTFLKLLERIAFRELKLPKPDIVFLLDVPSHVSRTLMHKRTQDQHERDQAYQKNVAEVYHTLAAARPWRTVTCTRDGRMRTRKDIHEEIWLHLKAKML